MTPFWRRLSFAYATAAVFLIAAFGLGALAFAATDRSGRAAPVVARAGLPDNEMSVVYLADEELLILVLDLPAAASGRAYQAWHLSGDGAPRSLGLVTNDGTEVIEADLSGATAIAISLEPVGGSQAPTSTPILVANLR